MAGILGVRACGHAARIWVRQHGGGRPWGAGASSSAPTPCVTGDKAERKKRDGERADRQTPHVSGCDCVLGGRWARWAVRWNGSLGLLAGGEKRRWSGELQEPG
jgi:hypothetical protein